MKKVPTNSKHKFNAKNNFFHFTTQRPVAITMIVMGILVFGFLSYNQLALTLMPDITYPSLTVRTEYEGTAPEEVETAVSRPIEEALSVVGRLVNISSISKEGRSDVILEFDWDTDMNDAISEVREKLDMVFLPQDSEKPLILRYDPSLDPIMRLALSGKQALTYLRYIAEEQLKRELEAIPGVAAVKVKGGYEEEILVELDEEKITIMGMDIQQIRQRLNQENINLAGGKLKEGETEYIVRTVNEFKTVKEIGDISLGFESGRNIKLKDLAIVKRSVKEREIITKFNGRESVELEIYKEADANIVTAALKVREKVFGSAEQQAFIEKLTQPKSKEKKEKLSPQNRRRQFRMKMQEQKMTNFISHKLPKGMNIQLLTDQSVFIKNSIDEVKTTAIIGGILAVIVLLLFLRNIKTTIIVSISIPISILVTFAPMNLFSVSINIMSLGGLALGIGMLVDNSIVVLESIFRCQEEGDDLITSVVRGVSEVGTAVMASTLTTIAVFFPMVFVQGIAGQIFGNLALTVVFSLLASLMVALFVIPMTASLRFKTFNAVTGIEKKSSWKKLIKVFISYTQVKEYFNNRIDDFKNNKLPFKVYLKLFADIYWIIRTILFGSIELAGRIISAIFMGFSLIIILFSALIKRLIEVVAIQWLGGPFNKILNYVSEKYTQLIEQALEKKKVVISLAFASFLITVFLILPRLGSELIPEVHQGEFYVDLIYPIGTPVEKTAELVNQFEEEIRQLPLVEKVATVVGSDMTNVKNIEEGEHTSRLTVRLKQHSNLEKAEEETIVAIRNLLKDVPGVKNSIARPVLFSFKTPVEIIIKGYHLEELLRVSRLAQHELSEIPGLQDVKTNLQSGNPEVRIAYDRQKLAFYNLDIQTVAAVVRNKIRGDVATEFKEEDRRIDILVRIKESDRKNLSHLQRININSNGDKPIPLNAVALIKVEEGPSEIRRINQERAVVIGANISGRSLSDVSADIYQILQQMELPADFTFEISGQNKEMEVSLNSLKLALLLAIFLVYIVMASQFESFLHPLIILFTVPLAVIGVILILWILSIPISIVVFLGLIMLAGIVVNNAIVLIDYINRLRLGGKKLKEAIILGGKVRLRPILMTTMTTVLGLLPMAIGMGDGAEIRTPMAITVIAGLISSTLLTLIIIPCVYAWVEELKE